MSSERILSHFAARGISGFRPAASPPVSAFRFSFRAAALAVALGISRKPDARQSLASKLPRKPENPTPRNPGIHYPLSIDPLSNVQSLNCSISRRAALSRCALPPPSNLRRWPFTGLRVVGRILPVFPFGPFCPPHLSGVRGSSRLLSTRRANAKNKERSRPLWGRLRLFDRGWFGYALRAATLEEKRHAGEGKRARRGLGNIGGDRLGRLGPSGIPTLRSQGVPRRC